MQGARIRGCILLCALLTLAYSSAIAGTTGSLAGTITDEDGKALVGASVFVEGTQYGAMTDAAGEYYIYALAPGTYSITAGMVGRESVSMEGVRVIADQVTRIDFRLGMAAVGHTVIQVSDQRNLVLENVPATIHVVAFDEMRTMPVPDMLEVLSRQPGIIAQGGAIHVRGGRAGEVAYLLDGIPVRSPVTNSFASVVPTSALSEASIITGGIGAEYGNAMSGVVNMVSRDGGDGYEGEVVARGGDLEEFGFEEISRNYSEPSENDNYRDGCMDLEASLGGPEPLTTYILPAIGIDVPGEVGFFGSARFLESGRSLEDSRGYWENNWQNGFNGSMKISSRIRGGTRISLLGFYNYRQSGWDEWAWSRIDQPAYIDGDLYLGTDPDYAIPVRFQETGGVTGSLTQMLSDETFFDLRLNQTRFCHWRRIDDPEGGFFGEGYSPSDWNTMFYPVPRVADSLGFYHSGIHPEVWLESRSTVTSGRFDLTSRLSGVVELKTGVEGSYYDIYDYSVYLADAGGAYASLWRAYPSAGAVYSQTALHFGSGMVLNGGLRFDLFNPNCSAFDLEEGGEVEVPVKSQLSPRLGVTHPVTDRDVFFVTYGHYFQMPSLNELFYGTDYNISGLYSIVGNPDLEAERTVAYEAGLRHRFSDTSSLALSAFYKDITGQVRTGGHFSETYDYYFLYENDDSHGTVHGLELKFLELPSGWVYGSASYTYSIARGRYSSSTEGWEYESGGMFVPQTTDNYLDWDQRHTADASLSISVPRRSGPLLGGIRILEGASLTLDGYYGSGFPFSPPPGGSVEPEINTERYPATVMADLGVGRKFWTGGLEFDAAVTVYNVFDRRNVSKIFDAGYYLETGDPGGAMGNPGAWSPARHLFAKLSVSW
ncbi:TonB-dependent receptor [Candidatus Fermentibacteria bacterium]|nr:TonB-dependent receptor [Candidatus Fermentibacteria bacterium]